MQAKNQKKITMEIIEEQLNLGRDPWQLLIEASKPQEVNSDDDPSADQIDVDQSGVPGVNEENPEATGEDGGEQAQDAQGGDFKLQDEEHQQVAQAIINGQVQDEQLQEMLQKGDITEDDYNAIMQYTQQMQPTPEEERQQQISQIQDTVIRFNIYDRLNELENKLDMFLNVYQTDDKDFLDQVETVREYIRIVNSLIFNLEINLAYTLYIQLENQLIQIFEEYLENNQSLEKNNTQEK